MTHAAALARSFFALLILGLSVAAHAQATRTWISGVGDDANPCSRTAPCKTFAGAISKTATGGTIDVLDPGGFGAVTITKSVTLENDGAVGGILSTSTNGIIVNDGGQGSAVVTLRGISLDGAGQGGSPGLRGVWFSSGKQLIIENCNIRNFSNASTGSGITFSPSTAASLLIRNSTIQGSGSSGATSGGVLIQPSGAGSANALLDNVHIIDGPTYGMKVLGPASVVLRNSVVSENATSGVWAMGGSGAVTVTLDNVTVSHNGQTALLADGTTAQIRLSNSTIAANAQGLQSNGGGSLVSFGNNRIFGNLVDGAPDSSVALQ